MADPKERTLADVGLFGDLNKRQLKRLAGIADLVTVEAGKELVTEGQRGRELLVIVSGAADVIRNDQTIASLAEGACIGEMSLLDREPATATVVTTAPSELVVIEGRQFEPLLEDLPGLATSLLATLSARLRQTDKAFDLPT
jgi:CRP-like cAMP-binding protein